MTTPAVPIENPSTQPPANVTLDTSLPVGVDTPSLTGLPMMPRIPQPSPSPVPLDDYTRQRLARADEYEEAQRQRATDGVLVNEAREIQREAEAMGLSSEDAQRLAQRYYNNAKQLTAEHTQLQNAREQAMAKAVTAYMLAQQYGVSAHDLLTYESPQAMEAAAKSKNTQSQEVQQLRVELAQLKRSIIPSQQFNSPAGSIAGNVGITPDNIDALYIQDHDRYGAIYRRFLATGQIR